jgi:hypothetical protein
VEQPPQPPLTASVSRATEIRISPEQEVAVAALLAFLADPEETMFVFSGFAGTGKTFCMREVIAKCKSSRVKFAFTAPTNKAAKELRKITGEATTIYSLLGLRIDKSGELKQVVAGKTEIDLGDYDAIFIDEAGMVNNNLFSILKQKAQIHSVKIVMMGDKAQLPPVGEAESPIWKLPVGASLKTVMRHDNQVLTLVTSIRQQMGSIAPSITLASDNANGEGVWKMAKTAFKEHLYNAAADGQFADGNKSKVIAWRNVRVAEYNQLIRQAIYGAEAVPGKFLLGDRIVAASPCMRGEDQLMTTDEEALVESALDCQHPLESRYKAIELKCRTENNRSIRLLVLHPDSLQAFNNDSTALGHAAKGNGKLWRKFWEHKELFHDIKYAYALTTHRSQGSTYESVWVDFQDILLNRNRTEAFQCLYVACSRPQKRLFLA